MTNDEYDGITNGTTNDHDKTRHEAVPQESQREEARGVPRVGGVPPAVCASRAAPRTPRVPINHIPMYSAERIQQGDARATRHIRPRLATLLFVIRHSAFVIPLHPRRAPQTRTSSRRIPARARRRLPLSDACRAPSPASAPREAWRAKEPWTFTPHVAQYPRYRRATILSAARRDGRRESGASPRGGREKIRTTHFPISPLRKLAESARNRAPMRWPGIARKPCRPATAPESSTAPRSHTAHGRRKSAHTLEALRPKSPGGGKVESRAKKSAKTRRGGAQTRSKPPPPSRPRRKPESRSNSRRRARNSGSKKPMPPPQGWTGCSLGSRRITGGAPRFSTAARRW